MSIDLRGEMMDVKQLIPDTYEKSVYDIDYMKLYENGIKWAVFDVDCTILPFDDVKVSEGLIDLFERIKSVGIKVGLCSSGNDKRVRPVGKKLNVKYISNARKPFFGNFVSLRDSLFDNKAKPGNMVMIGDSFYLDMIFAQRLGLYKIMVDAIKGGDKMKTWANDLVQTSVYSLLPRDKFTYGKYYRGIRG